MLGEAESNLIKSIGKFNAVPVPTDGQFIIGGKPILQNEAFLLTNAEFVWFVESWDIKEETPNGRMQNKKLYPAKVSGLNMPSFWNASSINWQDGIVYGLLDEYGNYSGFQPGFGQTIPADQNRAFKSIPPITANASAIQGESQPLSLFGLGAFGRLLSIAAWVDPDLAKKYDAAPKGKKKPESPNKIDYDEYPVNYPPYDVYEPQGYYY